MKRLIKYILIALIIVVIVFVGLTMCYERLLYKQSYQSSYTYDVSIYADSILQNVELYIPLPVHEGKSTIENIQGAEVVETEHGKMLKISTGER
jgi:hypothetical protein